MHLSSTTPAPPSTRPTTSRLLYRRGLPDLPELLETEEDVTATSTQSPTPPITSRRGKPLSSIAHDVYCHNRGISQLVSPDLVPDVTKPRVRTSSPPPPPRAEDTPAGGMVDISGQRSGVYGECLNGQCLQCLEASFRYNTVESEEVRHLEEMLGEYMSPPSTSGSDCISAVF
jgi:hypothetical protein